MSCRLNNIKERQRILKCIASDFSEPYVYEGCSCQNKDDLLKIWQNWDNLFVHVDNVRYVYRNSIFTNSDGKTYRKPLPVWYETKYSKDFQGLMPHQNVTLDNTV